MPCDLTPEDARVVARIVHAIDRRLTEEERRETAETEEESGR